MLAEKLKTLKRSDGKINSAIIRRQSFTESDLCKDILAATYFLKDTASYSERFYVIEHNLTEVPICPICELNVCNFSKIDGKYNKTCSTKQCIVKSTQSNIELSIATKNKNKLSIIDKIILDDSSLMSKDDIIEKINDIGISRIRMTAHYDLVRSLYHITKNILPILSVTSISERYYHVLNGTHSTPTCCICNVNKTSFINLYAGYRKACSDRICVTALSSMNRAIASTQLVIEKLIKDGYKVIEFDYLNSGSPIKLECPLGHTFSRFIHNGRWTNSSLCVICNDSQPFSMEEKRLLADIKKYYNGNIIENYKFSLQKEIDIFIPEFNIGIEYNGIYWHSYDRKETVAEKGKHYDKTVLALSEGIKLIQFNSIDYIEKYDIIHSRIKNLLNLSSKIYARKCTLGVIDIKEEKEFLDQNHLQGYATSTVAYKLSYNGETVAIMSFVKNRFGGTAEYELLRYASKIDITVVGGASRLFKHFLNEENPKSVISYSLLDWGSGNLYKELGFSFIGHTSPNFIYVKNGKCLKRYSCQKHKLKKLLGNNFNENISAADNMFLNGWRRYWDSGSTKWIYNSF